MLGQAQHLRGILPLFSEANGGLEVPQDSYFVLDLARKVVISQVYICILIIYLFLFPFVIDLQFSL